MNSEIEKLKNIILNSNNIVFFGGAGVSTESGIPDYRSADGLYQNNPETILSHSFFLKNPEIFFEFYKKNLIFTTLQHLTCIGPTIYLLFWRYAFKMDRDCSK